MQYRTVRICNILLALMGSLLCAPAYAQTPAETQTQQELEHLQDLMYAHSQGHTTAPPLPLQQPAALPHLDPVLAKLDPAERQNYLAATAALGQLAARYRQQLATTPPGPALDALRQHMETDYNGVFTTYHISRARLAELRTALQQAAPAASATTEPAANTAYQSLLQRLTSPQ